MTTPAALIAFLWHLKRDWLPAAASDTLESLTMTGPNLNELQRVDPFTFAAAAAQAERLCAAQPVEDEDESDSGSDTLGHDRASVWEREDEMEVAAP